MAFAPKDLSSLNMLGRNLGQAVQTQFRNDLMAANMERDQQRKQAVGSALQSFTQIVNDPKANIGMKRAAKANTIATLAGMGAIEEANVIEKSIDFNASKKQFIEGKEGAPFGVFDPETSEFKSLGTNPKSPVKPQWRATGEIEEINGTKMKTFEAVNPETGLVMQEIPKRKEPVTESDFLTNFFTTAKAREDVKKEDRVISLKSDLAKAKIERDKHANALKTYEDIKKRDANFSFLNPSTWGQVTDAEKALLKEGTPQYWQSMRDTHQENVTRIENELNSLGSTGGVNIESPREKKPTAQQQAPAAQPQQDQFEVGKVYEDDGGNRAKYLGNGQWQELPK